MGSTRWIGPFSFRMGLPHRGNFSYFGVLISNNLPSEISFAVNHRKVINIPSGRYNHSHIQTKQIQHTFFFSYNRLFTTIDQMNIDKNDFYNRTDQQIGIRRQTQRTGKWPHFAKFYFFNKLMLWEKVFTVWKIGKWAFHKSWNNSLI